MTICKTRFHGPVSFRPEDVLEIPLGLFGFAEETRFLLLEVPSSRPVVFVQSICSPKLCFISLPVQIVDNAYALSLSGPDLELLGYSAATPPRPGEDVLCLALLTIRGKEETTANLLAPLVIDIRAHRGVQVLMNSGYSHQHPFLIPEGQFAC
jgi:flagellar assembly factor FliW